jgi:hypothetical protein
MSMISENCASVILMLSVVGGTRVPMSELLNKPFTRVK